MKLIDSSGWLEYFTDGPLAAEYAEYLTDGKGTLVPTLVIYEVYRWIRREWGEAEALFAVSQLQKGRVTPLSETIALTAADLGLEHGLAMADSGVYATGRLHDATIVTSDRDFEGLAGVTYIEK